jgi:hypothetical protein
MCTYNKFEVGTKDGNVSFLNPKRKGNCYHTIVPLSALAKLTKVYASDKCDKSEVFTSPEIYINADNYVGGNLSHPASIIGVFGSETIRKLNFLRAKECGVYLIFPGYRFSTFVEHKMYKWLNAGVNQFESRGNKVLEAFPNPLVCA